MNSGSEPLSTLKERRTGQGFSFSTSLSQATQPDVHAKLSNCFYWLLFIETHAAHLPDSSHCPNRVPPESVRALCGGRTPWFWFRKIHFISKRARWNVTPMTFLSCTRRGSRFAIRNVLHGKCLRRARAFA